MTTLSGAIGGWARQRMWGWLLRASPENPTTNLANPASWLMEFVTGGGRSAAGVAVTEQKAAGVAVAYACVHLIAKTIGALPIHIREETERGPKLRNDHPLATMLRKRPNDYQSSFFWRRLVMAHVLLWGNHYSQILFDRANRIRALLPLHPWNVTPKLTSDGQGKTYEVRLERGGTVGLSEEEVLHIPGLSFDGLAGISVVRNLRNTFGLALATEDFVSRFFANGAKHGVILETPGHLKEEAQKNLVHSIIEKYGSLADSFKPLVLEEGVKMHNVTMPLEDAQFLGLQQLSDERICGAYGTPPHMVGITSKSTSWGSGIEQQDIGFAKHTISPWCVCIEQELDEKLLRGASGLYTKFSMSGLERGDYKSRTEGLARATGGPWMSRNEARAIEDMPLLEGAEYDEPLTPANLNGGEDPAGEDPPKQPEGADA